MSTATPDCCLLPELEVIGKTELKCTNTQMNAAQSKGERMCDNCEVLCRSPKTRVESKILKLKTLL